MAYVVKVTAEYRWVPDGAGSALMGQLQANIPGYGALGAAGQIPAAQEASDIVGEVVPGGDTPSSANFQTALNAAAADLYTRLTTANSVPGFTSGTLLALVQAWSSGSP